jgi:hypothetical protein
MLKKIIFLVFSSNYRFSALGNFARSCKYGNILIISLGGRFKSIIGRCLYFLCIGKFISIDGNPFLKNKKNSINLWLTGTSLKITKKYRNYDNNFVNMCNPVVRKEKNFFQIYPIIKKNYQINNHPKIIFMGKIYFQPGNKNLINYQNLKKNKNRLIKKFSLIDSKKFWSQFTGNKNILEKFDNYKIMKTYQREQIILKIHKNFKNFLHLFGEDSKGTGLYFHKHIYSNKKIKNNYNGNICIDTGSILGSVSLYPRSIQIIESGGLIIQTKQYDAHTVWGEMSNKIIFNNIDKLMDKLDIYLSNPKMCNEILEMIILKFKDSKNKIYENLQNLALIK